MSLANLADDICINLTRSSFRENYPSLPPAWSGHVLALSETIASLHKEKRELETELLQWRSRGQQLETLLQQHREKVLISHCVCMYVCVLGGREGRLEVDQGF